MARFESSGLAYVPEAVRDHVGYALYVSQRGGKHRAAKVLTGFGGAGAVEVIKDFRGDTFRAVYTVRYAEAVFVLHATPRRDMQLIEQRLREAEQIAKERMG